MLGIVMTSIQNTGANPLSVKAYIQLLNSTAATAINVAQKNNRVVQVVGVIELNSKQSTSFMYYAKLSDGSDVVQVNVPRRVIDERKISSGQYVNVTGQIKPQSNLNSKDSFELRLDASDMWPTATPEEAQKQADAYENVKDILKSNPGRRNFPLKERLVITLVTSQTNQVEADFMGVLDKVINQLEITRVQVNMTAKTEIIKSVLTAKGDVLVIIRGGGGDALFKVFDDLEVMQAIASFKGYRILGLGHTGNATLSDLVCDYAASTPTKAGLLIAENLEPFLKSKKETRDLDIRMGMLNESIRFLEGEKGQLNSEIANQRKTIANLRVATLFILLFTIAALIFILIKK